MEKTYNGWANYATWRVKLELFDDTSDIDITDVSELADYLEEEADQIITGYGEHTDGLAVSYARAFLSDVDYYEIAHHIIDENAREDANA